MGLDTEKSTIMINSTGNIGADISMNGQKLEAVTSLKYLAAILCKDGTCSAVIRGRIASAMTPVFRPIRIRMSSSQSFTSKFKLYQSPVISIPRQDRETRTLLADSENGSRLLRPIA